MQLEKVKITRLSNAVAAGTTDINATAIDVSGFETTLFVVLFGAIVANAVTSVKAQGGAASDGGDAADLEGTSVTVADDQDNKMVALEIHKPVQSIGKYVRPVVKRATQNATVDGILAIQFDGRKCPIALDSTLVAASKSVASPALGTA